MNERRAKGLCFHCDEPFTPDHAKVHRKAQLFMLDLEDEEELENVETDKENHEPVGEIA